jgi:hypothetical protein
MLEPVLCVTPPTKAEVASADLVWNPYIARIKFSRPLIFIKRASPFTATTVNRSPVLPAIGITWLEFDSPVELF